MANKRIKDLGTTASTLAADDYVAIDGNANGTRKIVKGDLVNDISTQVAGTYLDEANNLSDVASKDTSKLNLEVPDVGTAPNEVPLSGQLGSMAFQDSSGVSVEQLEADTLTVDSGGSTQPTQSVVTNAGAEGSALELRNSAISADTATALTFTNSTIAGANYGKAKIAAVRTNEANGNTDIVISTSSGGSLSDAVRIDSSGNVTAKSADPVLTVQDTETASGSANATLRLAESGAAGALGSYWDIKANGGALEFNDEWNEGGGTGTRMVLDDAGRLGVGLSNPGDFNSATRDLVVGATTSNHGISIVSGTGSASAISFADSDDSTVGRIQYDHAANSLKFRVNGGEKWYISSDGNLVCNTAGKGINFGVVPTSGPSPTSSTLSDYEEGTWTPTVGSITTGPTAGAGAAYSGRYTKIGRMVYCSIDLDFDNAATSVAVDDRWTMTGLPFSVASELQTYTGAGSFVVYGSIGSGVNAFGTVGITETSDTVLFYVTHLDGTLGYEKNVRAIFSYETDA